MNKNNKSKGVATASLILGILFWMPIFGIAFSLLAIISGIIAHVKIKQNPDKFGGRGLASAGIVFGAIGIFFWFLALVLGILAIIYGWAIPQFVHHSTVNPMLALFGAASLVASLLGGYFGIFFAVGTLSFLFWLWMLVDCLKREFPNSTDKIVWILVLIFTYVLGAAIYYFVARRAK